MKMFYSTLREYVDRVQDEATNNKINWPVYKGDFFPYNNDHERYWTGYFTSRHAFKQLIKRFSSISLASTTLYSVSLLE